MEDSQEESPKETKESVLSIPEIPKALMSELKKTEPVLESYSKAHYWLSAIMVGTFVWFIGSFDKFLVNGVMPLKWLYLLGLVILAIAVLLIGLSALMFLSLRLSLDKFYMDTVLVRKELTKEEILVAMTTLRSSMAELVKVEPPLKYAYIFYGIGVALIAIYIFVFIIFYL